MYTPDAMDKTPETAMLDGLARCKAEKPPNKAIAILLWDEGGDYNTKFFNSGMTYPEIVALTEFIKFNLLKDMSPERDDTV